MYIKDVNIARILRSSRKIKIIQIRVNATYSIALSFQFFIKDVIQGLAVPLCWPLFRSHHACFLALHVPPV